MKRLINFILLLFFHTVVFAQTEIPAVVQRQFEQNAERIEDQSSVSDELLDQLQQYINHPLNLNEADENSLTQLGLSPLQINALIQYRSLLGMLIDIHELQSLPGWSLTTIQRLLPFVSVKEKFNVRNNFNERISGGEHTIILRASRALELSEGYKYDTSSASSHYLGSPDKLLFKYSYNYRNLLQLSLLAEKDPGEEFFKGYQKSGFDFYSASIFLRRMGIIKSFAIGDYTINMGQGLIQWQGFALGKSSDVMNIKRQSEVVRPYHSAGEINFHRGVAITIQYKKFEVTSFISLRKLDANKIIDSFLYLDEHISSFQTSGYHRTNAECLDKSVQHQFAYGGNISFSKTRLKLGINFIKYHLQYPLIKSADLYNLYQNRAIHSGNISLNYAYTYRNFHFFGETATSGSKAFAAVNGVLMSVATNADVSLLLRNLSPRYQSLNADAFSENATPSNENGFFCGLVLRPSSQWQLDGYFDLYTFPWLKYNVNAPSSGTSYQLRALYKPKKALEIIFDFKSEINAINYQKYESPLRSLIMIPRKQFRINANYSINKSLILRSRVDMLWYDHHGLQNAQGVLLYTDLLYKPMGKAFSGGLRLQYFQTDNYNSRLYAFENDPSSSGSISAFYNKGYRYYLNIHVRPYPKMSFNMHWGYSIYPEEASLGSGADKILKSHKTEISCQLLYHL